MRVVQGSEGASRHVARGVCMRCSPAAAMAVWTTYTEHVLQVERLPRVEDRVGLGCRGYVRLDGREYAEQDVCVE